MRLMGAWDAGLKTGDGLGPFRGLPIGVVIYFNYLKLLNLMAEVHGNRTHTAIYEILLEVENAAPKTGDCYHDNGMDKEIIQRIATVATSKKGLRAS